MIGCASRACSRGAPPQLLKQLPLRPLKPPLLAPRDYTTVVRYAAAVVK